MKQKKIMALGLCLALFLGFAAPACAIGGFHDVTDPDTARNIEVLQMMGVLSGMGYQTFAPEGSLTRAQFTKMAVMVLGKGDLVEGYKAFTIFPDVKSSHWAAGYVNLAVRGEGGKTGENGEDGGTGGTKFIAGYADGTFAPEQNITYGQAVTILMRLLDYTDADVGISWPTGYLNAAKSAGLTEGVSLDGNSVITRAQAAKLFVNLLSTKCKGVATTFAEKVAATVEANVILLDGGAKAEDGSPAIETSGATYKLSGSYAPQLLQGRRGMVLLNAKGEAWTFAPNQTGSVKDVVVASAKGGSLTDKDGREYTIPAATVAYYKGEETTYGKLFVNLRAGNRVTLHLGVTGKVECVLVPESTTDAAVVIEKDGSGARLGSITEGRTDYAIYRHGEKVTAAALKAYDVATYFPGENRVEISTLRLTGYYQNASPNTDGPSTIKMLGQEFDVLPSAMASLSGFKLGSSMTILLTQDFRVAGAVDPTKIRGNAMGIAKISGTTATVNTLEGLTLTGTVSGNSATYDGYLVHVSSGQKGSLSLTKVGTGEQRDSLNVVARKMGTRELSADLVVFERVGNSQVTPTTLEDIRLSTVPPHKIQLARTADNGKVDLLILDNVSGDCFVYGYISYQRLDADDDENQSEGILLETPTGDFGPYAGADSSGYRGKWGGIVADTSRNRLLYQVTPEKLSGITKNNWQDDETIQVSGVSYTVAENVICYHNTLGDWVSLEEARAYGDGGTMTAYYDEFNVVRIIELN